MEKPQMCHVAFIDILGFSKFVANTSSEKVHEYLSALIDTTNRFYEKTHNYLWNIFSDSIVISVPVEDGNIIQFNEFVLYASTLQMANIVLDKLGNLPLRGAIATDEFFTDGKSIMFGKALVEAYRIESDLSVYPRILVCEKDACKYGSGLHPENAKNASMKLNAFNSLPQIQKIMKIPLAKIEYNEYSQPLRRDFDGLLHCNYLSCLRSLSDSKWTNNAYGSLVKHREFIEDNIKKSSSKSIAVKYHWMRTYHNWFCEGDDMSRDFIIETEVSPP